MKTLFTTILLLCIQLGYGQITIQSSDMPIPLDTFRLYLAPAPTLANDFVNKNWDYSNITPTQEFSVAFFEEEIPDFVAAGIDVYRTVFKNFNANFGYSIDTEIDFNQNGVQEKGMYVAEQRYPLGDFSGNDNDSLIIPRQGYLYNSTVDLVKFPFTYQSTWTSVARRSVDFNLTITAFGLNNTPAEHVWYVLRKDTIIGYGKMKIYTELGASKTYDVLVDRIESFAVDSFYLGGQPAPPDLLTAFSIQQGQISNIGNRINFYRKGLFWYLASFYYGTIPFDQQPSELYVCDTDTELATSSEDIQKDAFVLTIYPTLLSTSENLNIIFSDVTRIGGTYHIYDMNGKLASSGSFNPETNFNTVDIPQHLTPGQYIISFQDKIGALNISEKFIVH